MRHSNVSGSRGYRLETVLVWKSGAGRFNTVVGITRAVRWASRVHVFMMSSIWLSGRGLRWDTGGVKDGCGFEMDGSRRESFCADFSMVESWDVQ